ncbi:MAG: phosphopentomutase [Clostridia bacterium]|nr:phosphopentomutase [Clostridia bacterium]
MFFQRIFIIVLDSFGIGNAPDAANFSDAGSNTLLSCAASPYFALPHLQKHGLFNIDGVTLPAVPAPLSAYARLREASAGKDTTIGHWEIAGLVSERPLPVYPDGFPPAIIAAFEESTGRKALCNKPYSGTKVIEDYGAAQEESGAFIVYTSADSVFQIAANTAVIPLSELYSACEKARRILQEEHGVGRVIARPFIKENGTYRRTADRRDFSLEPPQKTMLDYLCERHFDTISVGKIYDIFAHRGISEYALTHSNAEGMAVSESILKKDFTGICFTNLVDFDMLYGHRNDVDGYAKALAAFDSWLPHFCAGMRADDLLLITADHGCDPATPSTDHSRECVPLLAIGQKVEPVNLGTLPTFAGIAKTILENFQIENTLAGESFLETILRKPR